MRQRSYGKHDLCPQSCVKRSSYINVHLSSFKNPIDFPDNSQISFAATFAPKPREANECLVDGCGPVMERSSSQ